MAGNTMKDMTTNFGKLDKFEGHDFRRWQKKIHFLLRTLKVIYVLSTPMPELLKDATVEAIRIRAKWENGDYICRGHILNGMSDSLFDVYTNVESAKELWDSLESKYMAEDSLSKKFLAQDSEKGRGKEVVGPSVNMTEEGKNKNNKLNKGWDDEFEETYFDLHEENEDRTIPIRSYDPDPAETKTIPRRIASLTALVARLVTSRGIVVVVDAIVWWINFDAITNVCKDCCWFKTYEPVEDGFVFYMGDDHFAPVHEKGSVVLEFSSGKYITLFNVLYVPKLQVIDDEIGSIMENNTWVLSDLPPGCKPLGFRQKEGIDYLDTYAPVARITTIRLLLALAAIHNLVIHQMDVKTSFLNGKLEEEVYMKQPEGFVMPGNEHKVCKLVKSLYGLKQAPKQWHQKFDEVVLTSGFLLNQSDKCVYSKFDSSGNGVIIFLYVDDMLIFGTYQNQVDKTKKFLSSRFSMKDMREADIILGIKIKPENKEIVITQSHYIEKILKKFNREDCYLVSTTMDPVEKLKPNTVGRLSRLSSNPSIEHWHAITRVFKYLKGTMNYGLSYVGYP
nr:zinc finger, CCHC-type [Tanacetum cinerariifolium]